MNRLRLAAFIVATVAAMAWLVARVRADEPLYFPTVGVAPKIEPKPLVANSATTAAVRDVVIVVPDFRCGACEWLDEQLKTVPGIRITKRIDMNRQSWPWLSVPDTGHEWSYPLTAGQVRAILREFPPVDHPAHNLAAYIDDHDDAESGVVFSPPRSPQWPAVRAEHLRSHPRCEACGSTDDLQVHHIVPFSVDASKEVTPSNLLTLCGTDRTPDNGKESRNCHLHIGHRCADGRGRWTCENPRVVSDAETLRRTTAGRGE